MNIFIIARALPLTIAMLASSFILIQSVSAAPVLSEPEYIVEDQNGDVLGGLSRISFKGQVLVAMYNSTHDERYWVQIFTTSGAVAPASNLISEQLEVWYSELGCTGTAYIKDPANAGVEAALRGATYAIGRKAGLPEDSIVLRGSGTGTDNSGVMMSKFKASTIPFCNNFQSTTTPTVVATQIADLSNFVRPFKYK